MMATPKTNAKYEQEQWGKWALSGYNAFCADVAAGSVIDDTVQAAFTTVATVLTAMDNAINAATLSADKSHELRQYRKDFAFGADFLGISAADVANSNTRAAFRAIITPFLPSGVPATYLSIDHASLVAA